MVSEALPGYGWSMRSLMAAAMLLLAACGSPYLRAGRAYVAQGRDPIAVEVLAAGLARTPDDEEVRSALLVALQTVGFQLRDDVDHLVDSRRYTLALGRLMLLEENARHARELGLPAEDPAGLGKERRELALRAVRQMELALDLRSGRGSAVKADLVACRRLAALAPRPAVQRICQRLRQQLGRVVVLASDREASGSTPALLADLTAEIQRRNPELLEVVSGAAGRHDARLVLALREPRHLETGWVPVHREAYHTWVPKLDRGGRQVEMLAVERPSRAEIEEAGQKGQPPPEPRESMEKVWEQVRGEYRHYLAVRSVAIPFEIALEDLRNDTLLLVHSGTGLARSESRYVEYRGHPRARAPRRAGSDPDRDEARPLSTWGALVEQAERSIVVGIADVVLAKVD
jgi:hypothetical protein